MSLSLPLLLPGGMPPAGPFARWAFRPTLGWMRYRRRGAAGRQALLDSGREKING